MVPAVLLVLGADTAKESSSVVCTCDFVASILAATSLVFRFLGGVGTLDAKKAKRLVCNAAAAAGAPAPFFLFLGWEVVVVGLTFLAAGSCSGEASPPLPSLSLLLLGFPWEAEGGLILNFWGWIGCFIVDGLFAGVLGGKGLI